MHNHLPVAPAAPRAVDIFLMMYPWNWEFLFTKLLDAGKEYASVAPAHCNALALQLKHIREGKSENYIT